MISKTLNRLIIAGVVVLAAVTAVILSFSLGLLGPREAADPAPVPSDTAPAESETATGAPTVTGAQNVIGLIGEETAQAAGITDDFIRFCAGKGESGTDLSDRLLEAVLENGYSDAVWPDLTGSTLAALMAEYQGTARLLAGDAPAVLFTGLLNLAEDGPIADHLFAQANGVASCVGGELLTLLQNASLTAVNQVYCLSDAVTPDYGAGLYAACEADADIPVELGADLSLLAGTWPDGAAADTVSALADQGVMALVPDTDIDEPGVMYFVGGGVKFALLFADRTVPAETWWEKPADPAPLLAAVTAAKENADLVIVCLRWDPAADGTVSRDQRTLAESLAAAGADLVVGDSPDLMPGGERVGANENDGGAEVWWSLGRFWYDMTVSPNVVLSVAPGFDADGRPALTCTPIPCYQRWGTVSSVTGDEAAAVLAAVELE